MRSIPNREVILACVAVAISAYALPAALAHLRGSSSAYRDRIAPPPLVTWSHGALSALTLGHRQVYEDLIDIWAAQTLTQPNSLRESPDQIWHALEQVLAQKPRSETFYTLACYFFYNVEAQPQRCLDITTVGIAAAPESWRIPAMQGFVFQNLLKEPKRAAVFFEIAASRSGCPDFYGAAAKVLAERTRDGAALAPLDVQRGLDIMHQMEEDFGINEIVRRQSDDATQPAH